MPSNALHSLRLLTFESRRAKEINELISTYGGQAHSAPSMREVPLRPNESTDRFLDALRSEELDVCVFTTGVGVEALNQAIAPQCTTSEMRRLLKPVTIVARGPKPRAALRKLGIDVDHSVREPNTWHEIVDLLAKYNLVNQRRIAVHQYGRHNENLDRALIERGGQTLNVSTYRWAMPSDLTPLRNAVDLLCDRRIDVAVFTSGQQCVHLIEIAARLNKTEQIIAAANNLAIASIGPICSEVLSNNGFLVDIEPAKPKLGPLIHEIATRAVEVLRRKR